MIEAITCKIDSLGHMLCLLDYDGTLVPIADHPSMAVPSNEILDILQHLSMHKLIEIFIISGRPVCELKKLIPLTNLTLVGSHGSQIHFQKVTKKLLPISEEEEYAIQAIYNEISNKVFRMAGVFIERKESGFTLHYRLADIKDSRRAINLMRSISKPWVEKKLVVLQEAKLALELLSSQISKKNAVSLLLNNYQARPRVLYIGDDTCDEEAFTALSPDDISIFVSKKRRSPSASFHLSTPREVFNLLFQLRNEVTKFNN